ncbi:AI-2E family transporter [Pontibacter ramchanderi]|uniref:Putative PurR-regulated permease PerM n=1 Tax=Pontibacter ramchanderi TaxID=1179743 RepID=A0A2N3UAF5_9BACT|nr:AI-2E family transporter [Pontibacter ramchanderi]PKV66325.1 putative PurR-regulated permease PerM [Pontibacter ramchanderi]
MEKSSNVNWLKLLQYILLVSALLYFGRTLFVPLSFSLLISFILYPVVKWMEDHGWGRWTAILCCLLTLVLVVGALSWLLVRQMVSFGQEWPTLQEKLLQAWQQFGLYLERQFGVDDVQRSNWVEGMIKDASSAVLNVVRSVLYASVTTVVLFLLIPLYAALILYNREQLAAALFSMFPRSEHSKIRSILHETITTYYNFIKGMIIVYAVVGFLNSVGLLLLGIPHAVFFGIVASILTFIPYVGISIGAILPMAVAWITYDSIWYPIGVVMVFTVVQYLEANLIFPLAVSYRLQVNMLFTLLAIVAGGILWGASGMILFVPFVAILKLIADKHEELRPVSLLLGSGKAPAEPKPGIKLGRFRRGQK